jgi:hypothetical protein
MTNVWTQMANQCTQQHTYARKKAIMYRILSNEASTLYADAKEEADKADSIASRNIRKIKKKLIILSRLTTLISLFQQFKSF